MKKVKKLSDAQQLALCNGFNLNSKNCLLEQAQNGWICFKAQKRLCAQPDAAEIFLEQAQKGNLRFGGEMMDFELPNAEEILLAASQTGYLSNDTQMKSFE